jgi:hypothetical protein
MDEGEIQMNPESKAPAGAQPDAKAARPAKDYGKATPEEIMADIERTRAHMDETLDLLGQRMHLGRKGEAVAWSLGAAALGTLAWIAVRALRGRKSAARRPHFKWREARVLEQAVLAAKLAKAARKGKPAIIVVEPRKV